MKIADVFLKDPTDHRLANNGVAEVSEDFGDRALATFRYELETFVCDGQYERGLDRILTTFLDHIGQGDQPGVWISGFYGSGKTHLAKMLRALWVDLPFPNGATATSIASLPESIRALLKELGTQGKRLGGLHAAAGKLGAGANDNVRLALLGLVFRSARLPEAYHQARFVMWLKKENLYQAVVDALAAKGESLEAELPHMYVSPALAGALLEAYPELADSEKEARALLRAQYPTVTDVSTGEMVQAIEDALTGEGGFPLTLVVLDEVQQFIANDTRKSYDIQELTETCCKHFNGRLLFVATGQSALSALPQLQKLLGRFPTLVALSDTDVDRVIRQVILAKKPSAIGDLREVLDRNLGEISRHLRGSHIEHRNDDESVLAEDYPILPTRRRFWERVLHTLDVTGTVSQLRNQLRMAHEAARQSVDWPLGRVVSGAFLYDQNAPNLLQTAVLSREVYEHIQRFTEEPGDGPVKAEVLKLIFLVNKLPTEAAADIGVRPTADTMVDLMVPDLNAGSSALRAQVPRVLQSLQDDDQLVMAVTTTAGTEYRLQTAESTAWHEKYREQEAQYRADAQRLAVERTEHFKARCQAALSRVNLVQGQSGEARQLHASFDATLPKDHATRIYAWFQDGWTTTEKNVLADARNLGLDDPTLFVFIPAQRQTELDDAIVAEKAARMTLDLRGAPTSPEGMEARSAMETRLADAKRRIENVLDDVFADVRVFRSGGTEVDGSSLADKLQAGGEAALVRLYPKFDIADHAGWGKAYDQARKKNPQALEAVGHSGEADKHPVAKAILAFLGPGRKGADIRDNFKAPPYGWPQDAIDGALFALLAGGYVLALDAAQRPVAIDALERSAITRTFFKPEKITVTPVQLIKIRKLFQAVGVTCNPGEESQKAPQLLAKLREAAEHAGGDPPQPAVPDRAVLDELSGLHGNELLADLHSRYEQLSKAYTDWVAAREDIAERLPGWNRLQHLLEHADELGPGKELRDEAEAIRKGRLLLSTPDPVPPLRDKAVALLHGALSHKVEEYNEVRDKGLAELQDDAQWQSLGEADQQALLRDYGLEKPLVAPAATVDAVLDALERTPLRSWADRVAALPGRFQQLRLAAAKKVEPQVTAVQIPRRVLHDQAELDAWLEETRRLLESRLANGPIIV